MPLNEFPIVGRFEGLQIKSETQAYACCPAHDDSRQSLGIGIGHTGNLGLKCFAGCSTEEILRAVGGTYADLARDPKTDRSDNSTAPGAGSHQVPSAAGSVGGSSGPRPVATKSGRKSRKRPAPGSIPGSKTRIEKAYDYRDESGTLLFQVCRLIPKDFWQRQPDPNSRGGWKWSAAGVRKVLYRLPEVLAAAEDCPDEAVWIVEGEKDADLLAAVGAVSTTLPGGAGKWLPEYSESLRGRDTAIIPDEDEIDPRTGRRVGIDHAYAVAKSLTGIARSVKIVWLSKIRPEINPVGKIDLGRWVTAGGTPGELQAAYANTPVWDGQIEEYAGATGGGAGGVGGPETSSPQAVDDLAPWELPEIDPSGPPPWTPGATPLAPPPTPPGAPPDSSNTPDDDDSIPLIPIEEDDDPHRLARLFLEQLTPRHAEGYSCRFWNDQWWFWTGRSYYMTLDNDVRCRLTRTIKAEFDRIHLDDLRKNPPAPGQPPSPAQKVEGALVTNVLQALKSLCQIPWHTTLPSWIPLDEKYGTTQDARATADTAASGEPVLIPEIGPATAYISMANGILDLEYLIKPPAEDFSNPDTFRSPILPHTPRFFTPVSVSYNFDPDAECPRWSVFLERNLEGDQDRIAMLQEWFGYCLTFDTSFQRFLFLEGEGSNGKSVICAALAALLGPDNVCHVALESFSKEFSLTTTLGKLANIVPEVGEIDKVAEGTLKSFTSGDRMSFNRKHMSYVESVPSARLVMSTNNRPRFSDRSGGLWRRMLILPLHVQIQRHERIHGMDKSDWWAKSGELPGMFNWALVGLMRLRDNKEFTVGDATRAALEDYRHEANPARTFLAAELCESQYGEVATAEVFDRYRAWCDRSGYRSLSVCQFGKEIPRLFPSARACYVRLDYSRTVRGYRGLTFRASEDSGEVSMDGVDANSPINFQAEKMIGATPGNH